MRHPKPKEWLACEYSQSKIADYKPYNFVDGEGVRCSVYVSGCLFQCEGCYNKIAQNFHYGTVYTSELEERILEDISVDYCQGLTLLGGEPFLNTQILIPLCEKIKTRFGKTKDIWAWSGYTYEELLCDSEDKLTLLSWIDVLVDGRFVLADKDLTLQFRGSKNQRIIDMQLTRQSTIESPVLWQSKFNQSNIATINQVNSDDFHTLFK